MKCNIYLIGYRGVGKSTIAPLLAAALGWQAVELDQLIVQQEGHTIAELFAEYGEPYFRRCEGDVLHQVALREQQVVSTGGGIVLAASHREMMRSTGVVIWLQAPVDVLVSRLQYDDGTRPTLTGRKLDEEVALLVKQREPLYAAAAHFTVDTGERNPQDSVTAILDSLRQEAWTGIVR
ncbi:MAG TPA: shikimate kinase AroL [Gemmatales bacterium]|nr:shikimate kinase AroL [Gemmatales bacterium]